MIEFDCRGRQKIFLNNALWAEKNVVGKGWALVWSWICVLRWRVGEHAVDMGTYRGSGGQRGVEIL